MERNLHLILRFCGAGYHGFQVQKNALSICTVFQDAVERILDCRPDVKGCSRTDAGVHAEGYSLSMRCDTSIPCDKLIYALNRYLPEDIAVLSCADAPGDFHARYSAKGKEYIYKVYNSRIKDPFAPRLRYRYGPPLREDFLSGQAKGFVGTHDFTAFQSRGGDVGDTVRTVWDFDVVRDGQEVDFIVRGDGFLYNMVRILVGTLVYISMGKIPPGSIPDILAARDRSRAGKTMPAHGLYLNQVFY